MTDAYVQLPTDGTGKLIDCGPAPLTGGLYRQSVQIGDTSSLTALANVKAAGVLPSSADGALVVTLRDGADPTGSPITGAAMPTGGLGVTGWLSAIWKALTGTLNVSTVSSNPSSIYVNQLAPGLTANPLPSRALVNGVVIKALSSNTSTVFIGSSSGVTNQVGGSPGYPLLKGESISYAAANLNAIYAIANNTADTIAITGN
jgi:hypothetical protein